MRFLLSRSFLWLVGLLLAGVRLSAVQLGDALEHVIAEKGKAASEMTVGTTKILNYADQTVKLKDGKVVELSDPPKSAPPTESTVKAPMPAVNSNELIKAGNWTVNCRAALAQAKVQHKRVFLLFTGSDWSAFSERFHKEILSTPEFGKYAVDNLILVMLDFPKKFKQPDAVKAQNEALQKAFKVERLPAVVLLNSEGKPLGTLPFEEGGPAKFIDSLKKL